MPARPAGRPADRLRPHRRRAPPAVRHEPGTRSPVVRFLAQRNALLCLVRNAPADVARRVTWRRLREQPEPGLRLAMAHLLPWALASRRRMRRLWTTTPAAVWERWAGADMTWDTSPARSFLQAP